MKHTRGVSEEARRFWASPSQARAFPQAGGALRYERELIRDAAALAGETGPVESLHVVGVGTGRELDGTRREVPRGLITAWDISPTMVEECERYVADRGWNEVTVKCGDVASLSERDGPADVAVLLNAMLCYVTPAERRVAAVEALRDLLRPGGTVAAVVHQTSGRPDWAAYFAGRGVGTWLGLARGGYGDRMIEHGGATMLFHHYRPTELVALFRTAGFYDVRVRSLRRWARSVGAPIPLKSPNPLLVVAR